MEIKTCLKIKKRENACRMVKTGRKEGLILNNCIFCIWVKEMHLTHIKH